MAKSADAFRTISEVSEWLDTPAHVLRFWESKFSQVKPVKRAGGRRYYRPSDMELLGGIKRLLHDDGMTIKGVQKLLRDKGVAHVSALSQPLDDLTAAVRDAMDSRARAKEEAEAAEAAPAPVAAPAEDAAPATPVSDVAAPAAAPVAAPGPAPAPVAAAPAPAAPRVPPANRPLVLSALLTRTTPLPDPARAEIAALQQRLSGWLSRQCA
jgi:DNA-binding transcriptional MerR regulator